MVEYADALPNTAVEATVAAFGGIDIVVNSAGYGLFGALEEVPDADLRAQFETNVFGVVNVLAATLPSSCTSGMDTSSTSPPSRGLPRRRQG